MALTKVTSGVRTIGTGEVATANISDDAVTATQIANTTVTATQIADSTITTAKMATDPTNASNLSSGSVPAGRLGNVNVQDLSPLKNDIATLALHSAITNNQAAYNLSNAFIDQFEDSSGIDATTDVTRVSSGEYMASVYSQVTDPYDVNINGYCASSGSSGGHIPSFSGTNNRTVSFGQSTGTSSYIASNIVGSNSGVYTIDMTITQKGGGNGPFCNAPGIVKDTCSSTSGWPPTSAYGAYNLTSATSVGDVLRLVYDTSDPNVQTTYKNSGSANTTRDNTGSNWLSIGTPTTLFFLFACWSDNATPWIWTLAGTREYTVYNNMTLISNAQTAASQPNEGRLMIYEEASTGSITLDTDIKGYVSRDNGTTYTQTPLTLDTTYATGKRLISGSVDISGQPAGTSMRYKIETLNQSDSKICRIHGASLLWA